MVGSNNTNGGIFSQMCLFPQFTMPSFIIIIIIYLVMWNS